MASGKKIAKLKDVAAVAGVSVAAVSRYLGGSLLLPPETASRIDAAVRSLNYQPNPHARRLSRGRSDVIGLVIPDIANPFFARIAAEIETSVDSEGYGLVLCITMNRPGREIEYLDRLRRNYVDGLIFMTNHTGDAKLAKAIKIREKRAQHPSDDRVLKVANDWLPGLNQQQSQHCNWGMFSGFSVGAISLDDLLSRHGLRP